MNNLEKTRETYRQIAAAYAAAWQKGGTVEAELQKFVALLPEGATVLDVGCGPGLDTAVLQSHHLHTIGLDYSHEMMRVGRDEHNCLAPFIQADMRRLPVGQQIDGIWASAALLHLQRDDMLPTLHEFWRALKPAGVLYLSVKQGVGEEWVRTEKYGRNLPRFFTFWQSETLEPLLQTAAFDIIDGWQEQGERDVWLVRYARKRESARQESARLESGT
jgi:ubiquinone/menaquinone biosynthesis C-methylase UbiE